MPSSAVAMSRSAVAPASRRNTASRILPDLLFRDLTDWSVVGPNGFPDYRYNDREIIRAFADNSTATFEWLLAHGVEFVEKAPDAIGGNSVGNSVPREMHSIVGHWPMPATGRPADPAVQKTRSSGNGMMRSLEIAARRCGVEILLEHRMTRIYRQAPNAGPVLGIAVDRKSGGPIDVRARKAVIIGTGGSTGNVNFRRMRIASPEMFPEAETLPHLICSRPMFIGGANDEADQHGGA